MSACMVLLVLAWSLQRCTVLGIVGGKLAMAPQPDAAVVFVQKFGRNSRVEGMKNDTTRGYYTYLGVKYAEPPIGSRRFQRANMARLEGEVQATRACAPCAQPHPWRPDDMLGSEDCLCLNIFAPKMPGEDKGSPVLFWVHGGGFRQGSASYYGGEHLAQKDTILVSVQYRLGSLGFLSNGNRDISSNVGLMDLSTALQWVLDYIEFFGGDPKRVVTMGQGSGGTAASLLALSPMSRNSVRGVAALSGAPISPTAMERAPFERSRSLARHADCPAEPPEALVACLRALPVEDIIKADSKIKMAIVATEGPISDASGRSGTGVAVEGREDERSLPPLVEESPADSIKEGQQKVPLLTGVVRDETARAVFGDNANNFIDKLAKIPDYINKEVVGPLQKQLTGLVPVKELGNAIPISSSKLLSLDSYYGFLSQSSGNLTQGLLKIVEATSDAFFNYPAFLSVDKWSAKVPAFLYRFEYKGNKTKGNHFLAGLPIVGNGVRDNDDFIGHGDELAYLFEPLDVDGKPLVAPSTKSTKDDHVRELFTDLIARFAHNASLTPGGGQKSMFNSNKNQYLQIGSEIKVNDNFRFCQMGLWGNIESRLQDSTCTLLASLLPSPISSVTNQLAAVVQPKPSGSGSGGGGLGLLVGKSGAAGGLDKILKPQNPSSQSNGMGLNRLWRM